MSSPMYPKFWSRLWFPFTFFRNLCKLLHFGSKQIHVYHHKMYELWKKIFKKLAKLFPWNWLKNKIVALKMTYASVLHFINSFLNIQDVMCNVKYDHERSRFEHRKCNTVCQNCDIPMQKGQITTLTFPKTLLLLTKPNLTILNVCLPIYCVFIPAFGCCAHAKAGWNTFFTVYLYFFLFFAVYIYNIDYTK